MIFSLEGVSLGFGEGLDSKNILKNISLNFEPGKMYVVTGPNGGGKTSLAKVLMGIYPVQQGRISLDEQDITQLTIAERARLGIRYAFQNPPRFKGIDVEWFLKLAAPEIDEKRMMKLLRQTGLCPEDYMKRMVDTTLSGGEMKRLEVASVLLGSTKVVILDEPEAGVDLWSFEQLLQLVILAHKRNKGRITIIISHSEKFLEQADEIIVMANGGVQERGTMSNIRPLIEKGINCRWRKICVGGELDEESQCHR